MDELEKLPIPAAANALVFMWTASTHLAVDRADRALGYVVWDKVISGKGTRFRQRAELILRGDKGRGLPVPLPAHKTDNIFTHPG